MLRQKPQPLNRRPQLRLSQRLPLQQSQRFPQRNRRQPLPLKNQRPQLHLSQKPPLQQSQRLPPSPSPRLRATSSMSMCRNMSTSLQPQHIQAPTARHQARAPRAPRPRINLHQRTHSRLHQARIQLLRRKPNPRLRSWPARPLLWKSLLRKVNPRPSM